MIKKKKVAIAVPLQQHSYRTAEALAKNNLLYKYYTTVFYNDKKFLYKILNIFLNNNSKVRMKNRYNNLFVDYVNTYYEIIGVIYLLLIRLDKKKYITPIYKKIMNRIFGKKIGKECVKDRVDVLIMYDTMAYDCFKYIKTKDANMKLVLDMASISGTYIRNIVIEEMNSRNKFKQSFEGRLKQYTEKTCRLYEKEIHMADYVLVSCKFSKRVLVELGINEDKIVYLPLGVDTKNFNVQLKKEIQKNKKIKFLFVGRVEGGKGIYYLLEAFKQLEHLNIELEVIGSIECDTSILEEYKSNVRFRGCKRKDEMSLIYSSADIYILPSLWEGFSLSLFEALSAGLPVIATESSIAQDVITDYKEGFVIPSKNIEAIKEKIIWFVENQNSIHVMSKNSVELANKYTWDKYSQNCSELIRNILDNNI